MIMITMPIIIVVMIEIMISSSWPYSSPSSSASEPTLAGQYGKPRSKPTEVVEGASCFYVLRCSKILGRPPTNPEVWGVFFDKNFAKVADKYIQILFLEHDFEDDCLQLFWANFMATKPPKIVTPSIVGSIQV